MPDVRDALHRGPTHVDRRRSGSQRDELPQAARRGVVEVQAHEEIVERGPSGQRCHAVKVIRHVPKAYASPVEWTPARIRLFRDVALCQSQEGFATTLGFAKRTIGNAERGAHPPSLALRRALDHALDNTSDIQRDRFLAAVAADQGTATLIHSSVGREPFGSHTSQVSALHGLRCAVLGTPLPMGVNGSVTRSAASVTAATAQAHRLYHLAEYDAAAQLLPAVLTCLQNHVDTGSDECLAGTLTRGMPQLPPTSPQPSSPRS